MSGNFFVIGTFLLGSLLFFTSQIKMSGIVKAVAYSGLVIIYALAGFLFDSPASILIGIPYLITLVSWLFYKANKQVRIAIVAIILLGGLGIVFGGSSTTSSSSSSSSSSGKMLQNGQIPGFSECLQTGSWSDDANENIRYCCKQVRGTLRDGVLYKPCEKKSRK